MKVWPGGLRARAASAMPEWSAQWDADTTTRLVLPRFSDTHAPHAQQWEVIFIVVGGLLGLVILCALAIVCRKHCRGRGELYDLLAGQQAAYGTATSKMWDGHGNPTEAVPTGPLSGGRVRRLAPEETRSEEEVLRLSRAAMNFCRSTGHERVLQAPLPHMGRRSCKFYGLVTDGHVNRMNGGEAGVQLLMTMITPSELSAPPLLPISSVKSVAGWRSLMMQLDHPYVLPTYDASVALDQRIFVLRPFCPEGALRDRLFAHQRNQPPPGGAYGAKYLGVDPLTDLDFIRPGRGLRVAEVARFGRQIVEGLRYLESRGVPFFHLHTGNVVLTRDGIARITDYENAFLGVKHRLHKKLRRLPNVDPQLASLACLLYELSTGIEPQRPTSGASPASDASPTSPTVGLDFTIRDPSYADVQHLIHLIVTATHSVTYDEILAHALFRQTTAAEVPRESPRALDSRTVKLLQSVVSHYACTVFVGHPSHCTITLPMKINGGISSPGNASTPRSGSPSLAGSFLDAAIGSFDSGADTDTGSVGSSRSPAAAHAARKEERRKKKKQRHMRDAAAASADDGSERD